MNILEFTNLNISYGKHRIIENLNLEIPKGKISVLIGPNGCGKSTLLKTCARVLERESGSIKLFDKDINEYNTKSLAKEMAFLPQGPIYPEGITVYELVSYGRFPHQKLFAGMTKEDDEIIKWAMESTGILPFSEKTMGNLSGGQRQRAWIAMVLAQKTDILLLDEPTTYLDISYQLEVLEVLEKINRENGTTIIMVLHEINNASRFGDNLIAMKSGKILATGEPNEVISRINIDEIYNIDAGIIKSSHGDYPILTELRRANHIVI